eukprot:scaffold1333_cov86-Cylindrotheca_fusiformis.AAC.6
MSSSKKQAPLNERDGNLLVAASNQLPQDDEEQEVVVVEKYSPASRARSPIEDCTVDQIVVTVLETNPIKKPKKNQPDSLNTQSHQLGKTQQYTHNENTEEQRLLK